MSKRSFFSYWNIIIGREKETQEDIDNIDSDYNSWMINKLISSDNRMLQFCYDMKRFTKIPNIIHYKALKSFYEKKIGKQKIYLSLIKKPKEEEDVKILSDYYNISYYDAVNYKEMISDDQMNELREQSVENDKFLNQKTTKKKGK